MVHQLQLVLTALTRCTPGMVPVTGHEVNVFQHMASPKMAALAMTRGV